jgi:8-oxo-dGTP pyrophosphatase MutT (NUDIX family)
MDHIGELRKLIGTRPIIYTGVTIIIFNDKNEILLQKNAGTREWGTIGGALELGESFEEAAKRELLEETRLLAHDLKFITLLSGREFYYKYPNGDEVYYATAVFESSKVSGEPIADKHEGTELRYFDVKLPVENLNPISRKILMRSGYLT